MEYKKTLNMPKSGFPMRAGLPKREPDMLKHWEEIDLYNADPHHETRHLLLIKRKVFRAHDELKVS